MMPGPFTPAAGQLGNMAGVATPRTAQAELIAILDTSPPLTGSEPRIRGVCQRPEACPCFAPCGYWFRSQNAIARGQWPDFGNDDDGEDA